MIPGFKNLDYYDILDISPGVDAKEIQESYYHLREIFAKNSLPSYSLYLPAEREKILALIDEAYRVLSDEVERQIYDRRLHEERARQAKTGRLQAELPFEFEEAMKAAELELVEGEEGEEEEEEKLVAKEREERPAPGKKVPSPAARKEEKPSLPEAPPPRREPVIAKEPSPPSPAEGDEVREQPEPAASPAERGEEETLPPPPSPAESTATSSLPEKPSEPAASSEPESLPPPPAVGEASPAAPSEEPPALEAESSPAKEEPPSSFPFSSTVAEPLPPPPPLSPSQPSPGVERPRPTPPAETVPSPRSPLSRPRGVGGRPFAPPSPPPPSSPSAGTGPAKSQISPPTRLPSPPRPQERRSPVVDRGSFEETVYDLPARPRGPTPLDYLGKDASGEYLRQVRESKGLTLDQVYQVTRIRRPILAAMEEENPKGLPADVFLKGMLLIYARFLEISNPEELVKNYMARLTAKREWMD